MKRNRGEAKVRIVGVTGATGAGKGVVCEILAQRGAYIIDTDKISHAIIERGEPAYDEIIAAFGTSFLDSMGNIMRRELGEIVFADSEKLKTLTEITHKYIIKQTFMEIDELRAKGGCNFVVIDAPLLIEAGMHTRCHTVIGVVADEDVRIRRVMNRDGLTAKQAAIRAKKQTPLGVLRKHADFIIENNGGVAELEAKAKELLLCFTQ